MHTYRQEKQQHWAPAQSRTLWGQACYGTNRIHTDIRQQTFHGPAHLPHSRSSSPFVDMCHRQAEGVAAASGGGHELEEQGSQKGEGLEHAAEHGRMQLGSPHNRLQQPYLSDPEKVRRRPSRLGKSQMSAGGCHHEREAQQAETQRGTK